jgi:hypothetical protein
MINAAGRTDIGTCHESQRGGGFRTAGVNCARVECDGGLEIAVKHLDQRSDYQVVLYDRC